MSKSGAAGEPSPSTSLSLNVSFTFAEEWQFGPTGRLSGFPPGGSGGYGVRDIQIAPVNLQGKTAAEIAEIQARWAGNLALVSQAIAAASIQFANALAAVDG